MLKNSLYPNNEHWNNIKDQSYHEKSKRKSYQ